MMHYARARSVVLLFALTACRAYESSTDAGSNDIASVEPRAGAPAAGAVVGASAGNSTGAAGTRGTAGASGLAAPDRGGASGSATASGGAGGAMSVAGQPSAAGAGGAMSTGGSMAAGGAAPELQPGALEDSGANCTIPELPSIDRLTAFSKHHDPFTMLDGSRIQSKAQWRCRRAEIKAQVERYESGPKPVMAAGSVSARFSGNTLSITVMAEGKSIQFSLNIEKPSGASGPVPLVIAFKSLTLDRTVFSQNGVATAVFDNDAFGAESGAGSRGTGLFYDLYGRDHAASSMTAWAWGISRILDALEQTPDAGIDPRRVAVTGCSRYGKGALLAGALDERIVLTLPQESGAGGSASWRVSQAQSDMGQNVQTLSSAANEQPWFRADFGKNFSGANVTKLPFDHHLVMGLVAPRALFVIDNAIDWLGIDSSFTAGSIAHEIWKAHGLEDRMGYWQTRAHGHCQFPSEQRTILEAYVKKFLVGGGTSDTKMLRADAARADLAAWKDWTAPSLQ